MGLARVRRGGVRWRSCNDVAIRAVTSQHDRMRTMQEACERDCVAASRAESERKATNDDRTSIAQRVSWIPLLHPRLARVKVDRLASRLRDQQRDDLPLSGLSNEQFDVLALKAGARQSA